MKIRNKHSDSGIALLAVLFFTTVVAALVATLFSITNSQVVKTQHTTSRAIAQGYADGVMESLFDQWRTAMINVTNTTDRNSGLSNSSLAAVLAAPSATTLPVPQGVTLQNWSVTARTPLLAPTTDTNGRPVPENGTSASLRVRLHYLATVTVQYSTLTAGTNTVTVQRTFVRSGRNLFDNFFFGTQPNIEFHPGPDMYVNGTVYVGGNLFTAHNTLHWLQQVTYTGTMTLNFRTTDSRYGSETPSLTAASAPGNNWPVNQPPTYGTTQKLLDCPMTALDPNFTDDPNSNDTDSDGNNNNNGFHEIIEEQNTVGSANPDPLQLDVTDSERLSANADYRIYVNSSNAVSVYKGSSTTALATTDPQYTAIVGALTTNTAIQDARESTYVRNVTVNVGALTTAYTSGKIVDSVGVDANGNGDGLCFYIKDTSEGTSVSTNVVNSSSGAKTAVTSSAQRGVKLVNGATLPSCGLTIATPHTVYIQGDYNTGTTGSTKPASNTATTYTPPTVNPSPIVTGYTEATSAVAGDAINILSNAWNDANSLSGLSSRVASNTTINTALLAGNVPTTTSSYSGGIENFTRFQEDWSSSRLTIYGALAQLFDSEQAVGPWTSASYNPPTRCWYFDNILQQHNPPGFLVARTYERGIWITR